LPHCSYSPARCSIAAFGAPTRLKAAGTGTVAALDAEHYLDKIPEHLASV